MFIWPLGQRPSRSQHTTVVSSSLYKCTDYHLLFITDRSRVYQPHPAIHPPSFSLPCCWCWVVPNETRTDRDLVQVWSVQCSWRKHSGAIIQDLIRDHQLRVLPLSETWIREDAPDAVKVDMLPMGFTVIGLHAHRSCAVGEKRAKQGGCLAFIHSTTLPASIFKSNIRPTSFELHIVGPQVGGVLVKSPIFIVHHWIWSLSSLMNLLTFYLLSLSGPAMSWSCAEISTCLGLTLPVSIFDSQHCMDLCSKLPNPLGTMLRWLAIIYSISLSPQRRKCCRWYRPSASIHPMVCVVLAYHTLLSQTNMEPMSLTTLTM